jgi:hypothetical protein
MLIAAAAVRAHGWQPIVGLLLLLRDLARKVDAAFLAQDPGEQFVRVLDVGLELDPEPGDGGRGPQPLERLLAGDVGQEIGVLDPALLDRLEEAL